jgi:MFS family permease
LQPSQTAPSPSLPSGGAGWQSRLPFFYGWVVVGSVFAALAVSYGVYYSFSVFFVALLEEYGWSRAATAGVFSVHILALGIAGIWSGRLIDRFGPQRIVPAGAVLLTIALVATSRLTELWQYYLFFGVFGGIGVSTCGWVPAVAVVSNWFSAKRGLAIGIASAGIGFGTVAVVPLCQHLISTIGWRDTYLILGGLSLLLTAPQTALLQVGRPEQLGLKVDGPAVDPVPSASTTPRRKLIMVDSRWATFPWTIAAAMRTHRFWFGGATIMFSSLTNQMMWAHEAAYLVDSGYDKMLAASVVGLAGFLSMPAKVLWGEACDRVGRESTYSIGVVMMITALAVLVLVGIVPSLPLLILFATTFAIGYAVNAPVTPSAAADIFAGKHFGGIFGIMQMGTGIGGAAGPWLAGYVFDVSGSYLAAFAAAAISSSLAAMSMWIASPRKIRRVVWR